MTLGIFGRKVGVTQVFDENGALVPVTVLDASGCTVTQVKTRENDGYAALQLGFGKRKPQNVNKARTGHYKKASVAPKASTKELRFPNDADMTQFKPGMELSVGMFAKGDKVDVIGLNKGSGFTGVFKRFNFHGKHATHGTSKYFRHGGSNGSNTFPGRVLKNKGMPGHDGNARVTNVNLRVVDVQTNDNLILVRGSVPGPKNGYVLVTTSKRAKAKPTDRKYTA